MKKSNYITIAFVVFFVGTILAMHIDSKLYEPTHEKLQIIRMNYSKVQGFNKHNQKNELTQEQWNEYISNASRYLSNFGVFPREMNRQAWFIYENYKKFNDIKALELAASWCEKAYEIEPNYHHLNDTYGCISFDLGYIERAVKLESYAVKVSRELNDGFIEWYEPRLEKFKKALEEKSKE